MLPTPSWSVPIKFPEQLTRHPTPMQMIKAQPMPCPVQMLQDCAALTATKTCPKLLPPSRTSTRAPTTESASELIGVSADKR